MGESESLTGYEYSKSRGITAPAKSQVWVPQQCNINWEIKLIKRKLIRYMINYCQYACRVDNSPSWCTLCPPSSDHRPGLSKQNFAIFHTNIFPSSMTMGQSKRSSNFSFMVPLSSLIFKSTLFNTASSATPSDSTVSEDAGIKPRWWNYTKILKERRWNFLDFFFSWQEHQPYYSSRFLI